MSVQPVKRYLQPAIARDLAHRWCRRGPQVGKTSLGRALIPAPASYLQWDIGAHREAILRREFPHPRLVLRRSTSRSWRTLLKGFLHAARGAIVF
jgi:hypothetical protein